MTIESAPRLVLHLGTGKTGSTAIQQALAAQPDALAAAGLLYPPADGGHHNALEALYLPAAQWHRVNRVEFAGREQDLVRQAEAVVDATAAALAAGRSVVLSSEYLYSLRHDIAQVLLDRLQAARHATHGVVYVRQPSAWVLSGLQQFLKHEHDIRGLLTHAYSFWPSIQGWTARLGEGRVHVREFSRAGLAGGDVVLDFDAVLGRVLGRAPGLVAPAATVNVSVSAEECIVLQRLKREAAVSLSAEGRERNRVINAAVRRAARRVGPLSPMRFEPGVADLIDRAHADELDGLRGATGIHFGLALQPPDEASRQALEQASAEPDIRRLLCHDPALVQALERAVQRVQHADAARAGTPSAEVR